MLGNALSYASFTNKGGKIMSAETVKRLIWASNIYFFGSKKIAKKDFILWYGFFGTLAVIAIVSLVIKGIIWVV